MSDKVLWQKQFFGTLAIFSLDNGEGDCCDNKIIGETLLQNKAFKTQSR